MKTKIFALILFVVLVSMKNDKPAYNVFTKTGEPSNYNSIIKQAENADIIFFGELHNNPVSHWLELQITKDLYKINKENLVLGCEMFESDNNLLINEYISNKINVKNFEAEAKLWPNYKTDYKPILEFAKNKNLKFIGTNIPRRYAAVVNRKGFEGLDKLSKEAKKYIAPLPINYNPEVECYKQMAKMTQMRGRMGGKASSNLPKAQAVKDATMAYFILKNLKKGETFFHFNGSYHSDIYQGIVWYIKKQNPKLKILTISTVEQDEINSLNKNFVDKADFIICVPEDMTKTY